jgi:hypothetical protein
MYHYQQRELNDLWRTRTFSLSYDFAPRPAPFPLSRQQAFSFSQSSSVSPVDLTYGRGRGGGCGEGAKSNDGEKAWSPINLQYSLITGIMWTIASIRNTVAQSRQSTRFFSSRPIWDPPPSSAGECAPNSRGTHSLGGEGMGGVPIRTRGQTLLWYSSYICTLCDIILRTRKGFVN